MEHYADISYTMWGPGLTNYALICTKKGCIIKWKVFKIHLCKMECCLNIVIFVKWKVIIYNLLSRQTKQSG